MMAGIINSSSCKMNLRFSNELNKYLAAISPISKAGGTTVDKAGASNDANDKLEKLIILISLGILIFNSLQT